MATCTRIVIGKTLKVWMDSNGTLIAEDAEGDSWDIVRITPDGKLYLFPHVDSELGLQLDTAGRICVEYGKE